MLWKNDFNDDAYYTEFKDGIETNLKFHNVMID